MTDSAGPADAPPSALKSLGAAHRRIAALLARLERHVDGGVEPGEQRAELEAIATGLDGALGMHLLDEERDVFPALLGEARSPGRHAQAFELVSRLLVEHWEMMEIWSRLRVALRASSAGLVGPPCHEDARRFITICRRHLDHEDREFADLLPAVPAPRLESMAASIAQRHADADAGEGGEAVKRAADPSGAAAQ